jgi:hypothetical protein
MNKICIVAVSMMLSMLVSNSVASDTPIKSLREKKRTEAECRAYIKKHANLLIPQFQCRNILNLGVVHACDNELFHVELSCNDTTASYDVFAQDGSDWKRFYR